MYLVPVMLAATCIAGGLRTLWFGRRKQQFVNVSWSNTVRVRLTVAQAAHVVSVFFGRRDNCRMLRQVPGSQLFARGDFTIKQLPCERDVPWVEVPVFIDAEYSVEPGETVIHLRFRSSEETRFDEKSADYFRMASEHEFTTLVEGLEDCERLIDEDANTRADSEAEAYATLNLKPGATWPEVQAAYREACRRYHPDSLAGQGVPPHLVELAVQQFKAITAAYKLLKSRYAELNSN